MPYFLVPYLLLCAGFALAARLLPARAWPWARDLAGAGMLLWWDPRSLALLAALSLGAWVGARWSGRLAVFWGGLLLLGGGFAAFRIAQRGGTLDLVLAPAGFGFAALRIVHWWVERAQGGLPAHTFRDLLGWMIYLPTVLVGPVQRFDTWIRWERRRRWDEADAAAGMRRVLHGYVRVVVLAFYLAGGLLPDLLMGLPPSLAATISGTATLYWTFAGVSDIAIGLGRIAGQRVPENFEAPFLQTSLPAFWRSWHQSVSEWCRVYVYIPIAARTRSAWLAAAAAMAVFALWHELTLAYVAWGLSQGLGLALWYRLWPRGAPPGRLGPLLGWGLTVGWVLAGFWLLRIWPRGDEWYAR